MKASDLIKELEKAIKLVGDAEIDEVADLGYDPDGKFYYMLTHGELENAKNLIKQDPNHGKIV